MVVTNSSSSSLVNIHRKGSQLKAMTARVLILGDSQVGKSASIVRYTTGRFIQQYSDSTHDWLYRHSLVRNEDANLISNNGSKYFVNNVEFLEQKDIQFINSKNFFTTTTSTCSAATAQKSPNQLNQQSSKLASRVALDQQLDNELHQKQNLLNKLHWANAYIIMYAINDINTFNKAIKYLNLIANNINSPELDHQCQLNNNSHNYNSTGLGNCLGNGNNSSTNNGSGAGNNRLSPNSNSNTVNLNKSPIHHSNGNHHQCSGGHQQCSNSIYKRPILLVGNKLDMEKQGRQVSHKDGRLLAMRHLSQFIELSIANSANPLEFVINQLIDSIDANNLHFSNDSQHDHRGTTLIRWRPSLVEMTTLPIYGSLVKSPVVGSTIAKSNKISAKFSDTTNHLPLISIVKSVETGKRQPMLATSYDLNHQQPKKATSSISTPASRYESLKMSFRRASMAIVGGKTFAKGVKNMKQKQQQQQQQQHADKAHQLTASNFAYPSDGSQMDPAPSTAHNLVDVFEKNCSSLDSCELNLNSLDGSCSGRLLQEQQASVAAVGNNQTNWIKNHIGLGGPHSKCNSLENSCAANNNKSTSSLNSNAHSNHSASRFRRPMFSYMSRRTTVALEEIAKSAADDGGQASQNESGAASVLASNNSNSSLTSSNPSKSINSLQQQQPAQRTGNGLLSKFVGRDQGSRLNSTSSYNSARSSSGRSSSSLSTTDTYYSSLYIMLNQERASSSTGSASLSSSNYSNNGSCMNHQHTNGADNGRQCTQNVDLIRHNSRSTLSRTSTSGGSCEDSYTDEHQAYRVQQQQQPSALLSTIVDNRKSSSSSPSRGSFRKKYQLVKSVQSTLTNLTKSSNISAQAAKRSFCNTLFKTSIPSTIVSVKAVTPFIATTEQNLAKPMMINYCK